MKIGFLITARLKSTRLPMKLLMQINGKSILEHVINRCKLVSDISEIVLCTSTNTQDKPLIDIAKNNDIFYYLGNELDVLKRLNDAAAFFNFDYIINITGENPLFSVHHANLVIDQAKKEKNDFIYLSGLPIGCAVYGLSPSALSTVCEVKEEVDTEIWGPLINQPEIFNVKEISIKENTDIKDLRITIDYYEDFLFVREMFSYFNRNIIPSFEDVVALLKENPSLKNIHSMHEQKGLDKNILETINSYYNENNIKIKELRKNNYDKR